MIFSNKAFDVLKWLAIVVLPALATFVKVLFPVWNIPLGDEIAATIVAVDTLLGALLGVSTIQYKNVQLTDTTSCYVKMAQEANDLREEFYDGREGEEDNG